MPASFGLECSHLHCTRVHNKRLQTPTSPCARAQLKTRASKKMPASTRVQEDARVYSSRARPRRCPRLLLLARVQEDARVSLPACVQEMPASTSTRAKMH